MPDGCPGVPGGQCGGFGLRPGAGGGLPPASGGCGGNELNDAPYDTGQTFTAGNIRIQVLSRSGDNITVRATYGTAAAH
nr:hypothetical protein GCM10017745_57470 [Saccharothrix mutabilis subsp. capreolus]